MVAGVEDEHSGGEPAAKPRPGALYGGKNQRASR
jgi:hypothetical protein